MDKNKTLWTSWDDLEKVLYNKVRVKNNYKNIEKLFDALDHGEYTKEEINWGNPVGKEIW